MDKTENKKLERSWFEPILILLNLIGLGGMGYLIVLDFSIKNHVFRLMELILAMLVGAVIICLAIHYIRSNKVEKKELQENAEMDSVEVDGVTYLLEKPKAFFRNAKMMGVISSAATVGHMALASWGAWLWFQKPNLVLWGNFAKLSPVALFVFSVASMGIGFIGGLICLHHAGSRLTTRKRQIEWVSTAQTSEDAREKFFKKWNFWMGRKEKREKQEKTEAAIE